MLRRISKCLPSDTLKQVALALIGSQVSYCAEVWGNTNKGELKRLQIAQNKAARIILKCPYLTPITERHSTLGWSLVRDIVNRFTLSTFHNIQLKTRPKSIYSRCDLVRNRHSINTRAAQRSNYVIPTFDQTTGKRRFT